MRAFLSPSSRHGRQPQLVTALPVLIRALLVICALALAALPAAAQPPPEAAPDPDPTAGRRQLAHRPQVRTVRHRPRGLHPTGGPRLAPVTVDFFLDPGDRSSIQLRDHLARLRRRHPRRVRVVYRLVASDRDHDLAVAAVEAHAQGRFDPFLDAAFASRYPPRRRSQIERVYENLGMDFEALRAAWSDGRHDDLLARNEGERKRRTDKAPSLLVNGRNVGRAASMSFNKLEELYRAAYAEARDALARGVPLARLYPYFVRARALERAQKVSHDEAGAIDGLSAAEIRALDPQPTLLRQDVEVPGHALGPPDAPVAVHIYCNFLLPNCVMLRSSLSTLREEFPDEVRLVFHHAFPAAVPVSEATLDPDRADPDDATDEDDGAEMAALRRELVTMHRAALCADEQGRFWDFYGRAYQSPLPRHRQVAAEDRVRAILDKIALDPDRFEACMSRPDGDQAVIDRVRAARRAGVEHTPAVVIDGRVHLGFRSSLELRAMVEEALTPGLLERAFPNTLASDTRFDRGAQ